MKLKFQKIQRQTITETIIDQIKERILQGDLQPGQQLPSERVLAETFSVGRTSVREAIRALQHMGILEVHCGEGTFLTKNLSLLSDHFKTSYIIRQYSVMELVEARKIIEGETVHLATKRSSKEEKDALKEIFETAIRVKNDVKAFLKADFGFHKKIAEMSHNSVLEEFFTAMRELTLEENLEVIKKPGQIDKAISFHEDILHCILLCDADAARKVMLDHLEDIEKTVNDLSLGDLEQKGGENSKG